MGIFEHTDYKIALLELCDAPTALRGLRSKLAEAINCSTSYLSQVLNGSHNLTLDQAESAATFFELTDTETEYLLACVNYARAGSQRLRQRMLRRMEALRREPAQSVSLRSDRDLLVDSAKFPWLFASALPALVRRAHEVPHLGKASAVAARLGLDVCQVESIATQLTQAGLLQRVGDDLRPSGANMRWSRSDPMSQALTRAMMLRTLTVLESDACVSAYNSGVVSASAAQAQKIMAAMRQFERDIVRITEESSEPPDDVFTFAIAFGPA